MLLSHAAIMIPPLSAAQMAHRRAVEEFMSEDSVPWASNQGYLASLIEGETRSSKDNDEHDQNHDNGDRNEDDAAGEVGKLKNNKQDAATIPNYTPVTYGEVTTAGARSLFYYMGMTGNPKRCSANDKETIHCNTTTTTTGDESAPPPPVVGDIVFVDLGSGVGKLVMQAYLELPRISRSIGIELSPMRHQSAVAAWDQLESLAKEMRNNIIDHIDDNKATTAAGNVIPDATVELVEGDFLQADLSNATHLFVSSLCFSEEMMYQLGTKLEQEKPANLHCVASLRRFSNDFERKGILDRKSYQVVWKTFGLLHRIEYVEMSWTQRQGQGCVVHVYTKPPVTP
jgi:hypothetical protein